MSIIYLKLIIASVRRKPHRMPKTFYRTPMGNTGVTCRLKISKHCLVSKENSTEKVIYKSLILKTSHLMNRSVVVVTVDKKNLTYSVPYFTYFQKIPWQTVKLLYIQNITFTAKFTISCKMHLKAQLHLIENKLNFGSKFRKHKNSIRDL